MDGNHRVPVLWLTPSNLRCETGNPGEQRAACETNLLGRMDEGSGAVLLPAVHLGSFLDEEPQQVILPSRGGQHHQRHPAGILW